MCAESPGESTTEPGPPLRVLCVDDNSDAADTTVELLCAVGFEARACYSGPAALALAETFHPGVCLLDLNMPGMDGDELALRLRPDPGAGPVVLVALTAMNDDNSRRRIAAAGFDLHLVKPVDPHQLVTVVDKLWHAWEARQKPAADARAVQ
ncbi:response regulator [Gemmata sp. JC717]|uniref:response regulator n=1 Tax=Gemmata algarum TaxID=2975278 RepID=UPI0021BA4E33|nr:response regulator [Gemmata algarum]MDY3554772.1 response regulator [Gemmata algarum]